MLIDDYMPHWDVRERHGLRIRASATDTYAALRTADFGNDPVVRALLGLRALPAAIGGGREGIRALRARASQPITLHSFESSGFRVLADRPPYELVIGLQGSFWKPRGGLRPVEPAEFATTPVPVGLARGVWSFEVAPDEDEACELSTETRVLVGPGASIPFRLYWLLIRPASGLIRRMMLRTIAGAAGSGTASGAARNELPAL